jgi:hypothetical protein
VSTCKVFMQAQSPDTKLLMLHLSSSKSIAHTHACSLSCQHTGGGGGEIHISAHEHIHYRSGMGRRTGFVQHVSVGRVVHSPMLLLTTTSP